MFFQPAYASVTRAYQWEDTSVVVSLTYVEHLDRLDPELVTY